MKYMLFAVPILCLCVVTTKAELIVFYDFDDASNEEVAVDSSGNDNHGEVILAEYSGDGGGHTGEAGDRAIDLGFYNDGAYVDIVPALDGAFESLTNNDQSTVSLWIFGSDEQPSPQWTFYAGPGRQIGSHIPWSDGVIYYDVAGCCGPNQRISLAADESTWKDSWNHYAFIKNEDYTAIYQNGELFHDGDGKDPLNEISEFFIGSGPSNDHRSYSGLIDDFGVWDVALSEDDIQKLFNGTFFGSDVVGDFDNDGDLDVDDINKLNWESASGDNNAAFDLNGDNLVDADDVKTWIKDLKKSWVGDANLDGEFSSADFVLVFQAGKFEQDVESSWADGDWNGDHRFDSSDFVVAFQDGGFEQGPSPNAVSTVPEPNSLMLIMLGVWMFLQRRKR